jgi:hypothetical protein
MRSLFPIGGAALLAAAATTAGAGPTQTSVGNVGGYATTCIAASTNGAGAAPGGDIATDFAAGLCAWQSFSGNGSASAQQSPLAGDAIVGGGAAQVSLGALHLSTTYAMQTAGHFPLAAAVGGYNDVLTVVDPSLTGQAGYLLIQMAVSGGLKAAGPAATSQFQLQLFKNGQAISNAAPGYDDGSNEAGGSLQWLQWRASSFSLLDQDSQDVDETVTFSVPFVFGTAFRLGVYAVDYAGGRNNSGTGHAQGDFSHSVYWAGVPGVVVGSQLLGDGFDIVSDSGVDWQQSFVPGGPGTPGELPAPATLPLLLAGITLMSVLTVRRRRD